MNKKRSRGNEAMFEKIDVLKEYLVKKSKLLQKSNYFEKVEAVLKKSMF